jgi:hypothetical protein
VKVPGRDGRETMDEGGGLGQYLATAAQSRARRAEGGQCERTCKEVEGVGHWAARRVLQER